MRCTEDREGAYHAKVGGVGINGTLRLDLCNLSHLPIGDLPCASYLAQITPDLR
jgi:hypothetical protein